MKESLYKILGDKISFTEIESFIYFLKACGAYNEFIKEMDEKRIMQSFDRLYMQNYYLLYNNIITASFVWKKTNSGFEYWGIIHYLHQIILTIKCQYKLYEYYYELYGVISKSTVSHDDFKILNYSCSRLNKENTKLKCFINELYSYLKENNFIKNI